MSEFPKISVIMPSLNVADYIEECIESVLNQEFNDIEVICVDAGSTDGTIIKLMKYAMEDSRVSVVNSSVKSYGYQMNLGLLLAKGEYIAIVETDDYISPKMFSELYALTENGSVDIAKGTFYHLYDYDKDNVELKKDWAKKELESVKDTFTIYEHERFIDGHPSIWAGIYRRKFLDEHKISFFEEPGGGWVDNGFFYETACAAKKIAYRPEPYYYYREVNPNSSSNDLSDFTIPIRRMIENLEILDKYGCNAENVLHMAYLRVFAYLNNIYRRDNYEKHMPELLPYIKKMISMLDEEIVVKKLNSDMQKEYYKYLFLDDDADSEKVIISKYKFDQLINKINSLNNELNVLKKEKNELISQKKVLNSKNESLISDNKKLNSKYNSLRSDYNDLNANYESLALEKKLLVYKKNDLHQYIKDVETSKAFKLGQTIASPVRKIRSSTNKKELGRPLNVLFVPSDNNRTSGAFLSMANLIVNMKNKYDVNELLILPNKGNGDDILKSFGINYQLIESRDWVVPLSKKRDDAFYKDIENKKKINNVAINKIREVIRLNDIDIIHINTTYSYVAAKAALEENIPFVWHLREFLEEDQSNTLWDRKEGNALINKANRIIAISDSIYKKYEDVFDKGKLVRIYNGIDAKKFYKPNRSIFNDDIVKFIMVGGFEYYKGQIEFAKACAKLYASGVHDFKVSFVGTGRGDVREEVENIMADADMHNVDYLGYKKNVEDYFDKADVSFTCAKSEAFGRTTVEAMLSGNIVVGADSAGTKELTTDKKTGILYKHGDSDDLYKKMLYVINNKEESRKIADNGRRFMYENMTAEINADNIYSLYEDVLSK